MTMVLPGVIPAVLQVECYNFLVAECNKCSHNLEKFGPKFYMYMKVTTCEEGRVGVEKT